TPASSTSGMVMAPSAGQEVMGAGQGVVRTRSRMRMPTGKVRVVTDMPTAFDAGRVFEIDEPFDLTALHFLRRANAARDQALGIDFDLAHGFVASVSLERRVRASS